MDSCGFLETFSWLIASSNDQEQRKVLKVESLKDLGLLANFPTLSLVLVKMRSPYQPANPKIKLMEKFKFNILLIAEEDWHRVSFTTNFIVGYRVTFKEWPPYSTSIRSFFVLFLRFLSVDLP